MLWDVKKDQEITSIPHKREYDAWLSLLARSEILEIKTEILRRIQGDEIATAGWIPESDWRGTPFQSIYENACGCNEEASAKCFGLIVWETIMEHESYWGFGRYELNSLPIQSMTYFKVQPRL